MLSQRLTYGQWWWPNWRDECEGSSFPDPVLCLLLRRSSTGACSRLRHWGNCRNVFLGPCQSEHTAGGPFKDNFVGQAYPGELPLARYQYEIVSKGQEEVVILFHTTTASGIRLEKKLTFQEHSPVLRCACTVPAGMSALSWKRPSPSG